MDFANEESTVNKLSKNISVIDQLNSSEQPHNQSSSRLTCEELIGNGRHDDRSESQNVVDSTTACQTANISSSRSQKNFMSTVEGENPELCGSEINSLCNIENNRGNVNTENTNYLQSLTVKISGLTEDGSSSQNNVLPTYERLHETGFLQPSESSLESVDNGIKEETSDDQNRNPQSTCNTGLLETNSYRVEIQNTPLKREENDEIVIKSTASSTSLNHLAKKTITTCSPSKGLSSIVEYGTSSSENEEDSEDSELRDAVLVQPVPGDPIEMLIDKGLEEDVVIIPTAKAVKTPLLVDIVSDEYRDVVASCSSTEDSEDDSDSFLSLTSSHSSLTSDSESHNSENISLAVVKKEPQDGSHQLEKKEPKNKKKNSMLTKGELSLDDLPPIEDLKISVSESLSQVVGYIHKIVDRQVVVQSLRGVPPVDLDSVLFLENGKRALGHIFDVFGPVHEPLYVVRFNSSDHVKEHGVVEGDQVFYAPNTEYTSLIDINMLMKIKGSDASGLTGNELSPSEMTDFSDDEEEAKAKCHTLQNKYESSSNEFQPKKKRLRPKAYGRDNRGRGVCQMRNPFSERGLKSMPSYHRQHSASLQPRFDFRGEPGPSHPEHKTSKHMANSLRSRNVDFDSRPYSPYTSYDTNYKSGQFSHMSNTWFQPPKSEYNGGPPLFPNHFSFSSPQSFPVHSSVVHKTESQVPPFPSHFMNSALPSHTVENFRNTRPLQPSSPVFSPNTPSHRNGFQNALISPTPPPPPSPSFSHLPGCQTMGPTSSVGHSFPTVDRSVNRGWGLPTSQPSSIPQLSAFSNTQTPYLPSTSIPSFSQPPPSYLQTPPPPLHFQSPPPPLPSELFHPPPPPPPPHAVPLVNTSVPPPHVAPDSYTGPCQKF
ncbi:H/ACA ribonucleoprotein complex non-core subunit naf1 [Halocaridina rubra]|uniref:H/ACA ribonucleoprotein complex non-core subunit NAF1 n=1 Tax=Halocaridina rubra TaxID=373956 RepID=A0AAN9AE30_HALRR